MRLNDRIIQVATVVAALSTALIAATVAVPRVIGMVRPVLGLELTEGAEVTELSNWERFAEGGHRIGPADAKLVVIEFGDYECPVCQGVEPALEAIRKQYSENVAFVFRHWPLPYHKFAYPVARAAECAGEQGKFWEFHRQLYADTNWLGDALVRFASTAGVADLERFSSCIKETAPVASIESDIAAAKEAGGSGTPTLIVDGLLLQMAIDSATLSHLIEERLSRR